MTTNADLYARRQAAIPRGVGNSTPLSAARAENSEVWDVEGNRYVDFAGGIAVLNTGHRHPAIMEAVSAQMERFTHTCFQVLMYESYIALAERLNAIAPIPEPAKSILFTTGAEAGDRVLMLVDAKSQPVGVEVQRTTQVRHRQGDGARAGVRVQFGISHSQSSLLSPTNFVTKSG